MSGSDEIQAVSLPLAMDGRTIKTIWAVTNYRKDEA
jgi:hypothetical protein